MNWIIHELYTCTHDDELKTLQLSKNVHDNAYFIQDLNRYGSTVWLKDPQISKKCLQAAVLNTHW